MHVDILRLLRVHTVHCSCIHTVKIFVFLRTIFRFALFFSFIFLLFMSSLSGKIALHTDTDAQSQTQATTYCTMCAIIVITYLIFMKRNAVWLIMIFHSVLLFLLLLLMSLSLDSAVTVASEHTHT